MFLIGYFMVTICCMLLPKAFVMLTRANGTYQQWFENTSSSLIERDAARERYMATRRVTIGQIVKHIHSDFIFTMQGYFFRLCVLANDASVFYPIYCFLLYIVGFPWFFGEFIPVPIEKEKRWGYFYIYGIKMLDGSWEPVLDTWVLGNLY